jgi:hypothetical protein
MATPTNTAVMSVGRLLEIRVDAGYRSVTDVDELFDAVDAAVANGPPIDRIVAAVDWRRCPVMSQLAAERVGQRLLRSNGRTERSAALASPDSPVAVLQFVRLIRSSSLPERKLFFAADELGEWLAEVLTPAETHRLREFLGESS